MHIHYVVQPVTRALMEEHGTHGPKLQVEMFQRGELPPEAEVEVLPIALAPLSPLSRSSSRRTA